MGKVFVGHDWAEDHHDVFIEDDTGRKLGGGRLPEGVGGIARFHEMLGGLTDDPGEVLIASETDRGLFVNTLVAAGYEVIAVNPMSTSRYRERHSTSGAKSDPGDAKVLADLARTDAHNHRRVAGDSELGEAIKVLARAQQSMIWTRQRQTNQLRSTLREFYPAALIAFDDLAGRDALAVLAIASTPTAGRALSLSKIQATLRRAGRQRRIEQRAVEIQTALRAEQLAAPDLIADAMGTATAAVVAVIVELSTQIQTLETKLADRFEQQSSGTPRTAMQMPSLARTTPACHPSPEHQANTTSCLPATHGTNVSPTPATCGPSPRSPPAPAQERSTTNTAPAVPPTTVHSERSPTASSASSTAASATKPSTTNTQPGHTANNKPLTPTSRGMSSCPGSGGWSPHLLPCVA